MSDKSMTDKQLMKNFQNGEIRAYELLFDRYHPDLKGYFNNQKVPFPVNEELATDVFLRIYKSADKYNEEKGEFCYWMYKIATNILIDYIRKIKVASKNIAATPVSWEEVGVANISKRYSLPHIEFQMEAKEMAIAIEAYVKENLSEKRQQIFVCMKEELERNEIADFLDMHPNTLRWHIGYIKQLLLQQFPVLLHLCPSLELLDSYHAGIKAKKIAEKKNYPAKC